MTSDPSDVEVESYSYFLIKEQKTMDPAAKEAEAILVAFTVTLAILRLEYYNFLK